MKANTMFTASFKSLIFLALLSVAASFCLAAKPVATVDRSKVTLDESFNLTLRLSGQAPFTEPDLSPLRQDFEILSTGKSSQYSITNGNSTSHTDWVISLMAKRTGALVIPPLELDGEQSEPIVIEVLEASNKNQSSNQAIFMESDLDREQVYVQAQLLYTVRLYHAVNLGRGATLSDPEPTNTLIRKLTEESYEKILGGVRYNVIERKYALFPQQAGSLTIPSVAFEANVPTRRNQDFWSGGFGQSKHIRLRTEEHTLQVLDKPAHYPASTWLPAQQVSLLESWSGNPDEIEVGQSITRTTILTGAGVVAAQLPELESSQIADLKFYPDQAVAEDKELATGITGKKTQSVAIIPTRPGTFELPEQRIQWWDVNRQTLQTASLPKRTIHVIGAAANSYSNAAPSELNNPQQQDSVLEETQQPDALPEEIAAKTGSFTGWHWPAISLILLLAWAYSSWQWFHYRRLIQSPASGTTDTNTTVPETEKNAFKLLQKACETNDAKVARAALLNWAKANWPTDKIQSLNDLGSSHSQGSSLLECIGTLESSLFSNNPTDRWNGKLLLEAVTLIRKQQTLREKQPSGALPPLHQS